MKLSVTSRDTSKRTKDLRKEWLVPAVIYGKHMSEASSVMFPKLDFLRLFEKTWKSTPIQIIWDEDHLVLVHDYQLHPVSDTLMHVDLLAVNKDEKVTASVPVILEWVSPYEKNGLWSVQLVLSEIEVEAFPLDLPHDIKIDISVLSDEWQVLHLSDLNLWEKVSFIDDLSRTVVTTAAFATDEEETTEIEWEAEWEDSDE